MPIEKQFTNELGNIITVRVQEVPVHGLQEISIYITGPTSDTENIVTLEEAEVIHELLGKIIDKLHSQN